MLYIDELLSDVISDTRVRSVVENDPKLTEAYE